MRALDDLDYMEIAAILALPDGTVKSRLNRGRTELGRLLRQARVGTVTQGRCNPD
jgi:RNA polymerase sigma-70 factor (ECF subfamily)